MSFNLKNNISRTVSKPKSRVIKDLETVEENKKDETRKEEVVSTA